jgi:hypothetical protein
MCVCVTVTVLQALSVYINVQPSFLFKGKNTYVGYFSKLLVKPFQNFDLLTVKLGILLSCAYLKHFKTETHINVFTDNRRCLKWLD